MRHATRRSRAAQQAGTRARLIECAHDVFLRSGFHAATLEAIAMQAGVTKGAVYSNFANKAQLFLAVSGARMEERLRLYRRMHAAATGLDTFIRAYIRIILRDDPDGRWASVFAEACAVASGDETFRAGLREQSARANAVIGGAILDLAERAGVEFELPKAQMVKIGGALMRGLLLQRLLDPRDVSKASIEDVYIAFMQAMIRPQPRVARFKGNAEERRMSHDRHVAAPRSRQRPTGRRDA
jgi:AcrR family transcriptional regulator